MYFYNNSLLYSCKPIKIKIKNENGAGDTMCALFNYYQDRVLNFKDLIKKSMIAGALHASGYQSNKKTYLNYIEQLSKRVKIKAIRYNG